VADLDVHPLTRAILTGLLTPVTSHVNQVNAALIAEARGIRVTESLARMGHDFTSLVELTVRAGDAESRVAGTIFGRQDPRIVRIDAHRLEAAPEGNLLVIRNDDQPGVVGTIGTFLGNHAINIAQLYLSRNQAGGVAMSVYQVDQELGESTLAELEAVPHVISAKQIRLS
jgi:D-3-phosphoglycerate dehydrogenase / 2-oxoglutarate reductase